MPIDLYYSILSAPARTVLLTARYLNVPNVKVIDLDLFAGDTKTPEFLSINPSHTVPALVDGDLKLFESRAIAAYLANRYAPENAVYPAEPSARAQVDKLLYFDASSYFPAVRGPFFSIFKKMEPSQAALDDLKEKLTILETLLGDQLFFTGTTLTLADISLSTSIILLEQFFPHLLSPKLVAWYGRVVKAIPLLKELDDELKKNPIFAKRQ